MKDNPSNPKIDLAPEAGAKVFPLFCGLMLGLGMLKFGNPVIFDSMVERPNNALEAVYVAWPIAWGYALLALVALTSIRYLVLEKAVVRPWIAWLPLAWLGWQLVSMGGSIDPALSRMTLWHFAATTGCFYLGYWALSRVPRRLEGWVWLPTLVAYTWMLWAGWDQRHGGLEATRDYVYSQSDISKLSPEYLLKLSSTRIFSTLVYPNAFAGAMLLFFPPVGWWLFRFSAGWPKVAKGVALGLLAYLTGACFVWTGSKGGMLIAMGVLVFGLMHLPMPPKTRVGLAVTLAGLGIMGFSIKFAPYFEKGATSVGARFDYWTAGVKSFAANPILGTGPGTFGTAYKKIKPPGAEMARLAHNDYLEQASDSGAPGFAAYVVFIWGGLWWLWRGGWLRGDPMDRAIFLGLLGWATQSFIEFGLYIPALAWPAFLLLGLLLARKATDKPALAA